MTRRRICELGVDEAYRVVAGLGRFELPPLEAIEYEDWGRDWLLSCFLELSVEELSALGLEWDELGGSAELKADSDGG